MSVTLAEIRNGCNFKDKMLKAKVIFAMDCGFKDPKQKIDEHWLKVVLADSTGHYATLVYLEKVFDRVRAAVDSGRIIKCRNIG